MKKILYWMLFPPIYLWHLLSFGIMYLGDALHWLGNAMTGFKADKSIGRIYIE